MSDVADLIGVVEQELINNIGVNGNIVTNKFTEARFVASSKVLSVRVDVGMSPLRKAEEFNTHILKLVCLDGVVKLFYNDLAPYPEKKFKMDYDFEDDGSPILFEVDTQD